ncbi:unnamed protein product [Cladocopium goreaui]|uniref:Methyltransferase type 11 domain-containing protein n=1 Tax=Cladocopium goreaui TaxID=2562237 RepID=A0A9P1BTD5_9DINO|nr:unnamed protein product [Cladocopium goreaui]
MAVAAPINACPSVPTQIKPGLGNGSYGRGSSLGVKFSWPALAACVAASATSATQQQRPRSGRHRCLRALTERDTVKMDGFPDELFYLVPRIGVYHVDDAFRAQLTELYRQLIPSGNVLDLCSQHDSHLPSEGDYTLTVHGMNQLELMANTRAKDRFTRNFNEDPSLRELPPASFDAVVMAVSIQYMQRPVDLLSEAFRVLKPGGVLIVSFSNRMFFTKAIEVWRSQRNMKGLVNLVLNYFRESGFQDVRAANRVQTDDQTAGWPSGDPFAAVVGVKENNAGQIWERANGISWLEMNEAGVVL